MNLEDIKEGMLLRVEKDLYGEKLKNPVLVKRSDVLICDYVGDVQQDIYNVCCKREIEDGDDEYIWLPHKYLKEVK